MVCITLCLLCLCGAGSWAEVLTGVCEMLTGWIGNCTTCTICYGSNAAGWLGTIGNIPNFCISELTGFSVGGGGCALVNIIGGLMGMIQHP
jgi:hypothetical protein